MSLLMQTWKSIRKVTLPCNLRLVSGQRACLSINVAGPSGTEEIRKNHLKDIQPDRKVLQHLDKLHLGYCAKRRVRVAVAKSFEHRLGASRARSSSRVGYGSTNLKRDKKIKRPYPFDSVGRKVLYITSVDELRDDISTPEVAIVGRSNVGKSTLINQLLGFDSSYVQKSEVSNKPGETRNLHLFALGKKSHIALKQHNDNDNEDIPTNRRSSSTSLIISDMPGFGFAFMNDQDKTRCEDLILSYLTTRGQNLKRVVLLLDARHGFKMSDYTFLEVLFNIIDERNKTRKTMAKKGLSSNKRDVVRKMQVVLTKCDLLERTELARRLQLIRKQMYDIIPSKFGGLPLLALSGKENKGVLELQQDLASLVPNQTTKDQ